MKERLAWTSGNICYLGFKRGRSRVLLVSCSISSRNQSEFFDAVSWIGTIKAPGIEEGT